MHHLNPADAGRYDRLLNAQWKRNLMNNTQQSVSAFAAEASLRILELSGITLCEEDREQSLHLMRNLLGTHGWYQGAVTFAQQHRKHGIQIGSHGSVTAQSIATALISAGFPHIEAGMIAANVRPITENNTERSE